MTQHLEPCPKCGRDVPCNTALDDGEDVRWAEWSCLCGLYYHAESRIVNERGVHDAEAELAELFGAWNTRVQRTHKVVPSEWHPISQTQKIRHWNCPSCGYELCIEKHSTSPWEWATVVELPNFCPNCGAKIEEVAE